MEFISAQLSILIWLVLISFILEKFPVEQLKILISGGTGTGTFSFKEEQQYCMSFWVYAKHFPFSSNSTRSEQPWQISLNALLTPCLPPYTLSCMCNLICKTTSAVSLPILIFSPPFFFLAITQWQCTRERECIDLPKWAAISQGESVQHSCPWMGIAHFTWPPCQ